MASEQTLRTTRPAFFVGQPGLAILGILTVPIGVGIVILVYHAIECRKTELIVTDARTILRRGGLFRTTSEVWHRDVRHIATRQGPLQQYFGSGEMLLSSAGGATSEIALNGIPDIGAVTSLIEAHRGSHADLVPPRKDAAQSG